MYFVYELQLLRNDGSKRLNLPNLQVYDSVIDCILYSINRVLR